MFSGQQRKTRYLFAFADLLLTALAFTAAYYSRLSLQLDHRFAIASAPLVLAFCSITWVAVGWWLEVYRHLGIGNSRIMIRDAFRQAALGALCLVLFEYVLRLDLSRFFLALFAGYSGILLLIFRLVTAQLSDAVRRGVRRYVLVVGTGERARKLAELVERGEPEGVYLLGFLTTGVEQGSIQLGRAYTVQHVSELPRMLRQTIIDEILFAVDGPDFAQLEEIFLLCDEEGVRTRVAVDFFPHVNSQIRLENLGETQLLTFSAAPDDDLRLLVKRALDLVISSVTLLVGLPVFAVIAVAVRLSGPGPVIFRQQRCGLNGRKFPFYKFRSMCVDAEARQQELMHLSERSTAPKIHNDPRVTPVGRILRKFSLDELPQLLNVLRGEMSLVGPRPAVPSEVAQYERWQRRRMRMRPGLTCLWAINGRDTVDFETWMKLDLEYIDNWSLTLDCKILLETIPRVISGKGAH